jgi:hypothetical protein
MRLRLGSVKTGCIPFLAGPGIVLDEFLVRNLAKVQRAGKSFTKTRVRKPFAFVKLSPRYFNHGFECNPGGYEKITIRMLAQALGSGNCLDRSFMEED